MKSRILILLFFICNPLLIAGNNGKSAVSVITLEPGNQMYTVFGHTAIRITNTSLGIDKVYNFGTFDFDDPFFYYKFVRGNLKYSLSVSQYRNFIIQTACENRTAREQVLDFSPQETMQLYQILETCYHSQARYYTYDFFYDNCATRVRDYISFVRPVTYDTSLFCCNSFRELIHPFISSKYWMNLGVNLALGKNADQKAYADDYMFLPVYVHDMICQSGIITSERQILSGFQQTSHTLWKTLCPWILAMLLTGIQLLPRSRHFGFYLLFSAVSAVGLILLAVTIISDNTALSENWNILWTLPALPVVVMHKTKAGTVLKWIYFLILAFILAGWNHMDQDFSDTFLPWITALMISLIVVSIKGNSRLKTIFGLLRK